MSSVVRNLEAQTEAAKALIQNLKDVIGDDDDLLRDTLDGETNLLEAIEGAIGRLWDLDGYQTQIDARINDLKARKERYKKQAALLRQSLLSAMSQADLKKLELASATISRKPLPVNAVILEEADIPSEYWKPQPPKLDKRAVLSALKDKKTVPGATLSNGGETVSIRGL